MWLPLFLLLLFSKVALSHTIIKTLPGYPYDLPFTLETGYIGVGELDEVQLFYYFIESEGSPKDDPLLLWLTGGPGCSGLSGLLYEIGPFTFNYANSTRTRPTLELNPYSWTKVANIIFLDAPVGTGFSYAKTSEAYYSSDNLSTTDSYNFLRKWLLDHPQFFDNPLYIAGDSYSGMIVPVVVQKIYDDNDAGRVPPLNIQGYLLGNPLTDRANDVNSRIPFAHRVSLLSDGLYESTKANCDGKYVEVDPADSSCINGLKLVDQCTERVYQANIIEPSCSTLAPKPNLLKWDRSILEENPTDLLHALPLLTKPWCRRYNYLYSYIWANDRNVREALHVREGTVGLWWRCNQSLAYSYSYYSTVEVHRNLTKRLARALIYSGDHDMVIPYVGTQKWIESLNLTVDEDWEPWFVDGQVAGYGVKYKSNTYTLTYTTIKGGGHTAPEYRPKQCLPMVGRWFAHFHL